MITTGVLVESILNGAASGYGYGYGDATIETLTSSEAASYTLESGAAMIAMECRTELHELLELAVFIPNEAVLAAKVEGYSDVTESATYGPVFEETEKKFGQKVIDFLVKLKDRVVAFFKNIFSRLSEFVTNYDKFLEKNKDAISKAASLKLWMSDWQDSKIDEVATVIMNQATEISNMASKMASAISAAVSKDTAEAKKAASEAYEKSLKSDIDSVMSKFGFNAEESTGNDMTRLNERLTRYFCGRDRKSVDVNGSYVIKRLTDVKDATKAIRDAQKKYEKAYKDAIKSVNDLTKNMTWNESKGYDSLINQTVSAISKIQNVINSYASAGTRAVIGRANESISAARCLMNGKASGALKEKE